MLRSTLRGTAAARTVALVADALRRARDKTGNPWQTGADAVEFARDHYEPARAVERFPHDTDRRYPGRRRRLHCANSV